jgi:IBR domain, a half RING-finger domain
VQDLQSENHKLSQEIVELRQKPNTVVGSTAWPVTLRMILMMRIMEANFGGSTLNSSKNPPVPTLEGVPPIPAGALDITLTPNQAHQLGQLLPDGAMYGGLYSEICVQTCTKCFKPRLQVRKSNTFAFFHDLDEYPKLCNVHLGDICSACGLEALLEAIWRDWWHDLGNTRWLKYGWGQNCFSWIPTEKKLEKVLNYFGCRDINDKDEYVKKYAVCYFPLAYEAHCPSFKKACKYRQALQDLNPRPDSKALDVAAQLHAHLIKKGYMSNFFDVTIGRPISEFEKVPEFSPGPIVLSKINDLTIPIFSGLFERQHIPKECIVCIEEKCEMDYGTLEQWERDCAGYTGPWMWSMLEYPNSAIQSCDHDFDVCRACTARHISTSLESGDVNQVTCAQCNRVLNYEEIRNLTGPETFERSPNILTEARTLITYANTRHRYDKILLRRALSSEPNFRWCLSSTCENGRVYDNIDPSFAVVRCEECGFMMCFTHQQPWHTNITCTEFDNSRLSGDPNYAQTQKCILGTTKGCPECGVRIAKGNGCFHMTCKCYETRIELFIDEMG